MADFSQLTLPIEKGEWCDADERMFLACFTILGQFMEGELADCTWGDMSHHGYNVSSDNDIKAIDLWLWYRDELPKIYEAGRKIPVCLPDDIEDIKNQKLRELMEIRQSLWT